jgi:hypothetical protein
VVKLLVERIADIRNKGVDGVNGWISTWRSGYTVGLNCVKTGGKNMYRICSMYAVKVSPNYTNCWVGNENDCIMTTTVRDLRSSGMLCSVVW